MDWELAIRINRAALLRVLAALHAVVGIVPGDSVAMLPASVRWKALRVLRPAESALRRLIVVMAQMIAWDGGRVPVRRRSASGKGKTRGGAAKRGMAFRLIDPRKRFFCTPPKKRHPALEVWLQRSAGLHDDAPLSPPAPPAPPDPDAPVSAARFCRRMQALAAALDDLPGQAKRMLRLMARRDQAPPGPGRVPPIRPGWPPGYRRRHRYPVDKVLEDCHGLALYALSRRVPDT